MPSPNQIPDGWSKDLRAAWDNTWKEPHMQAGLAILKEFARIKGTPHALPPGADARDWAVESWHYAAGQAGVFEDIERMRETPTKKIVPLDPNKEFTPPKDKPE